MVAAIGRALAGTLADATDDLPVTGTLDALRGKPLERPSGRDRPVSQERSAERRA